MADRAGDIGAGRGATDNNATPSEVTLSEYVILPNNRVSLRWIDGDGNRINQHVWLSAARREALKRWGLIDPANLDPHEGVALQPDGTWKVTSTASRLGLKPGRRPLGDRAMSDAERQRASRARRKAEKETQS